MKIPSLKQIDLLRMAGLRPESVGCIIRDGSVLITYIKKHNIWFFPQGGIDNREDPIKALYREMTEELGKDLGKSLYGKPELIYTDRIMFSGDAVGSRELKTDDGKKVLMGGKYYLFFIIQSNIKDLKIDNTEFDKAVWVSKKKLSVVSKLISDSSKRIQYIKVSKILEKYLR